MAVIVPLGLVEDSPRRRANVVSIPYPGPDLSGGQPAEEG